MRSTTLTTRTEATLSVGPGPAADVRVIVPVLACPRTSAQPGVGKLLPDATPSRHLREPVERVHCEVESVEVVEHDHVERRRGRPLLLVAAHVDVDVVGASVGEAVDEQG